MILGKNFISLFRITRVIKIRLINAGVPRRTRISEINLIRTDTNYLILAKRYSIMIFKKKKRIVNFCIMVNVICALSWIKNLISLRHAYLIGSSSRAGFLLQKYQHEIETAMANKMQAFILLLYSFSTDNFQNIFYEFVSVHLNFFFVFKYI